MDFPPAFGTYAAGSLLLSLALTSHAQTTPATGNLTAGLVGAQNTPKDGPYPEGAFLNVKGVLVVPPKKKKGKEQGHKKAKNKANRTPDMRYKANKDAPKPLPAHTKKDGTTADMRYKANKVLFAENNSSQSSDDLNALPP